MCSLSFTVAFLSPFVLSSCTNNVHKDSNSLSESKNIGSSVQDINQSLSSSLSFLRMLLNTYTPPSLNETNNDILSWNSSHSKEEFVQTSDHDNILSAKYSDSLSSCSSKKESGQTSDHSSSSFHTLKSNTENITLKKNDLSMSSS